MTREVLIMFFKTGPNDEELLIDFYQVLGVSQEATLNEITKCYTQLISENLPDKEITLITLAYRVLSSNSRIEYDKLLNQHKQLVLEQSEMFDLICDIDDESEKNDKHTNEQLANELTLIDNNSINEASQCQNDLGKDDKTAQILADSVLFFKRKQESVQKPKPVSSACLVL